MIRNFKWIGLVAILVMGTLLAGCASSDTASTGAPNNGGTAVSEETKGRLHVADDGASGGGTENTNSAAPPPAGN